jgi:hypothetical protein
MVFNQHAATGDDVPRFGVEQANARYVTLERCFAKIKDGLRRVGDGKQLARGLVDADIGGLADNTTTNSSRRAYASSVVGAICI